jgi:hypothetical protein
MAAATISNALRINESSVAFFNSSRANYQIGKCGLNEARESDLFFTGFDLPSGKIDRSYSVCMSTAQLQKCRMRTSFLTNCLRDTVPPVEDANVCCSLANKRVSWP